MSRIVIFAFKLNLILMLSSCSKNDDDVVSTEFAINFLETYNENEIPADTTYLASDLSFHCRALIAPAGNIAEARYRILQDGFELRSIDYTVNAGNDQGFLIDSIKYDLIYSNLAGFVKFFTFQIEATDKNGGVKEAHLTFKIQPVNYPFQFRFFDFNSSVTASPGESVTIKPFFSPFTVQQKITSMSVYRKIGFASEEKVDNYTAADFFYYQTGYLREYNYTVPNLPSGSGIIHRFELISSDGGKHMIQHSIVVK